jgi:hypothetical protein
MVIMEEGDGPIEVGSDNGISPPVRCCQSSCREQRDEGDGLAEHGTDEGCRNTENLEAAFYTTDVWNVTRKK